MSSQDITTLHNRTEKSESGTLLEIGQWYWVKDDDDPRWLGCIVHVGSNYVEMSGVNEGTTRISLNDFDNICEAETSPELFISNKVQQHRENVAELLNQIKKLTASLGIVHRDELSDRTGESAALAIAHGTSDIKAHKAALIKAQKETLPELFKQVEEEHSKMAMWMKANLIPMKANLTKMKESTEVIEDRIFTVELYAGLVEEVEKIQDGKPADNDSKVSLFQRRHYMDEECLVNYTAGGMEFKNIGDFDAWLLKRENLNIILPLDRCVVAFRVRRARKDREGWSMSDFINIIMREKADETTFLYIRNGEQVYRLNTEIDFGDKLFPDQEHSALLGSNKIYIDTYWSTPKILSEQQYMEIKESQDEEMAKYNAEVARWQAAVDAGMSDKERKDKNIGRFGSRPWEPHFGHKIEECNPGSLYYDDAMKIIAREAMAHNRVAVVLQGLLDRSPVFNPHPPWQLWTAAGFNSGIELIYDKTRAISSGEPPDFEVYRAQLNKSLKKGDVTVGQEHAWECSEADKENARRDRNWRSSRSNYDLTTYRPYGNPGPGHIAEVVKITKVGVCTFEWKRQRQRYSYYKEDELTARFSCSSSQLLNVSAYTPGDYKIFYNDPRTRADYLKWAPLLLAAEDYHAKKNK